MLMYASVCVHYISVFPQPVYFHNVVLWMYTLCLFTQHSGTLFLWIFWPSFNGVLAAGNAQTRAIINTYFAMTASVFGTYIFSILFGKDKKITMVSVQSIL